MLAIRTYADAHWQAAPHALIGVVREAEACQQGEPTRMDGPTGESDGFAWLHRDGRSQPEWYVLPPRRSGMEGLTASTNPALGGNLGSRDDGSPLALTGRLFKPLPFASRTGVRDKLKRPIAADVLRMARPLCR